MSVSRTLISTEEFAPGELNDDRARFVEPPGCRNRGSRGAITGVLLGAGLWGVILALAGVIKL
jgi:hypothetical protein